MTGGFEFTDEPNSNAERMLDQAQEALQQAVAIVSPETPNADPLEIFPAPGEVRAEDAGLSLDPEQEQGLREIAARFGFGRETDLTLSEQGIRGAHVVIEGGQAHKVLAEAQLVLEDEAATPTTLIFATSPYRKITGEAEVASTTRILGESPETEYEMVRTLISKLPGFEPTEEWEMPYSYDISDGFVVDQHSEGQFITLGMIGKMPVVLMRIDRENYEEDGKPKFRNQPGTTEVLRIVEAICLLQNDPLLPLAFATSATYQPSRMVDAIAVSLKTDRPAGLVTYGTARLARVKGEATPAPAPANQLPGELHKLALETRKLAQLVADEL